MPSLCNSTLSSSPDKDECQYWSSFSEKPFSCGDRLQVYKGKLNGKGPRGGDFSVAKVFVDQPGTEGRCCSELEKAQVVSDWLARFLSRGQYRLDRVKNAQLQMAPMDQVSMLNKFFAHNKRRPSSGEWVLLEEMVQERGSLVQFVDRYGRMYRERSVSGSGIGLGFSSGSGSGSSTPLCSLDNRELLEAFVHFTHHSSGGRLVVCGLEGREDEQRRLIIKTPIVHSCNKTYGETDLGDAGIREVMSRHVCNRHCRRVLRLQCVSSASGLLQSPRSPSSPSLLPAYQPRQHRSPSAPFDPEVVFGLDVTGPFPLPSAPPYDMDDFNIDVSHLPLDVFPLPAPELEELKMMFRLELEKKYPDEPPPPYTEFTENVRA